MEIEDINKIKDKKELNDFLNAFVKLEAQKRNPSRNGMIDALKEALNVAWTDIKSVEASRGETTPIPWEQIHDKDLYNKLAEYQLGMYQYAVKKYGEEVVKKLLEQNMS